MTSPFFIDSSKITGSEQPYTFLEACLFLGKTQRWSVLRGYLSELTVNFLRPAARRRERTAWPSAVFMRVRNPCVFTRRRLFGWKVLLGIVFPGCLSI
jgi:hypothetical protein